LATTRKAVVKKKTGAKLRKRSYSAQTLKVLFGLSGNRCAVPDCSNPIIASGSAFSDDAVVGQICHIFAVSDDGPRGKKGLTKAERNSAANLVLCGATHHAVIDKQHEDHPASTLVKWKRSQERAYRTRLSSSINSIGFAELEVAARALVSHGTPSTPKATVVPPKQKIEKNGLSGSVEFLLQLGAAKSHEVEKLLLDAAQLESMFPERLRKGFVSRYKQLKRQGYTGDDLFLSLYEWAGAGNPDQSREAAGLCILAHLFVICDVFEK
jgi:hypothetical protein